MRTLNAFVAHSFAPEDERKIRPIRDHLDSFHDLGFAWKSGEPAEADRVSDKIRRRISESGVFVGILTRKYPVYEIAGGLGNACKFGWKLATHKLAPIRWTVPSWIIQESGFALALNRKVILFLEPDLDFPLLQGDLEYIPYIYTAPADAFRRSTEMINKLIAAHVAISVETVVREEGDGQEKSVEAAPTPAPKQAPEKPESAEPRFAGVFVKFTEAIEKRDLALARGELEAGLEVIRTQETGPSKVLWQCFCLFHLYQAGDAPALEELKGIERVNPEDPDPPRFIAKSLASFKEYAEAARFYGRAAELSKEGNEKSSCLLSAARAYLEAKVPDEAERILIGLLDRPHDDIRTQATQKLYDILKSSGKYHQAFGLAEATLHHNPGLASFRFAVGLNYYEQDQDGLFMYHFNLLKEHEPNREDIMHNVALAFSECDLPITSVSHYKKAIELGGTLAASNLAYKYLDAGMVDEARTLLMEALKKEDAAPNVGRCLAEIPERQKKEDESYRSSIETANEQRLFLLALGEGLFQKDVPPVDGRWQMPFGEIELRVRGGILEGKSEVAEKTYGLRALLGSGGGPFRQKQIEDVRIYTFSGPINGRVCTFKVDIRPKESPALLGLVERPIEGYLVFGPDGSSARYAESKEKKLSNFLAIERVAVGRLVNRIVSDEA